MGINNRTKYFSLLLLILLPNFTLNIPKLSAINPNQNVASNKAMKIHGKVLYESGEPVIGAEVKIAVPIVRGLDVKNTTYTDVSGHYYMEIPVTYHYYHLLIQCHDNTTTGIDWIPVVYTLLRRTPNYNITTFLMPAATIVFHGPFRSILEYQPKMLFSILDNESEPLIIGDRPLQMGYNQAYSLTLELNESTIYVPTDREYKISSSVFMISSRNNSDLVLKQGEVKYLNLENITLKSDIGIVAEKADNVSELIQDYESNGYYASYEANQYSIALSQYNSSIEYYQKEQYPQAFIDLKTSYIELQNIEQMINENMAEASASLAPSLVFLSISAMSLSSVFTGKKEKKTVISALLILILYGLFYLIFPGKNQLSLITMLQYGVVSLISGYTFVLFLKYVLRKGHFRGANLYDAIISSISLASSNLRRRKLRSALVFLTLLVISMSFISLTSVSVSYGLVQREQLFDSSSVDGIIMKTHEYVSPYTPSSPHYKEDVGQFNPVDDRSISWLQTDEAITSVSRRVEGQPARNMNITGFDIANEPIMMHINEATVIGEKLQISGTCLVHEGRLNRAEKGSTIRIGIYPDYVYIPVYDIGDKIHGLTIVGAFNDDIVDIRDVDGSSILPLRRVQTDSSYAAIPIPKEALVITTAEDALNLGGEVLRVSLTLRDGSDSNSITQTLALSSNYRFWSSTDGKIIYTSMGDQIESKGSSLIVPYAIVIFTVVSTILGSLYERRTEIDILSSIGLNPSHISAIFLSESAILGFSGGSLGFLFGLATYSLLPYLAFAPTVRQKISAIWIFAVLGLSISSAFIGTLLALKYSVSLTPSLRRKWDIHEEKKPDELDKWNIDLPTKVDKKRVASFLEFMSDKFNERKMSSAELKKAGLSGITFFKISEKPDDFHFVRSSDHWTKDGDLLRSIDYVEFKKKTEDKNSEIVRSSLDREIEKDLKEKLDHKHKEVQEELSGAEKEAKEKKEVEEEAKKIEEAIVEQEPKIEEAPVNAELLKESPASE